MVDYKDGAVFSVCRKYRYSLWRTWSREKLALFIMLNPSTANESKNDPTISRCISFAKRWGYGGIIVGNLFAYRSPYPNVLKNIVDPIGPENDRWLMDLAKECTTIIGGWGNKGILYDRGKNVSHFFPDMLCLGHTKSGQPRHPLYIKADTQLMSFR